MHLFAHSRETTSLNGVWQAIPDANQVFEKRFLPRIDQFAGMDPEDLESEVDTDFPIDQKIAEDPPIDYDIDDGLPLRVPCSWASQLPAYEHYEGWM